MAQAPTVWDLVANQFDPPPSPNRERWLATARPEQLPPPGPWNVWLVKPGRGWGKTRTGAEDIAEYLRTNPGHRVALVAPTFTDGRDTMVEGESGLQAVLEEGTYRWNRSLGELIHDNGARAKIFSSEEPERLRGPQHHRAWCDELAAWRYLQATWDQLMFGLRLGRHPRCIVTTTPKPNKLVKELVGRDDVEVVDGSTFDNQDNLSDNALASLRERYEGTTLGRQELYGELIDEVRGALWTRASIDETRVDSAPKLERIVVAVDPAVTSNDKSDETGIVVAGVKGDQFYVLEDATVKTSPDQWAARAIRAYAEHNADRVVAEVNNGGDLVELVLRRVAGGEDVPYRAVRASRGKQIRAEPISALYEQGRVHHVGSWPELEDQMTTWQPAAEDSPDRIDALVWALTELSGRRRTSASVAPILNVTKSPWEIS